MCPAFVRGIKCVGKNSEMINFSVLFLHCYVSNKILHALSSIGGRYES